MALGANIFFYMETPSLRNLQESNSLRVGVHEPSASKFQGLASQENFRVNLGWGEVQYSEGWNPMTFCKFRSFQIEPGFQNIPGGCRISGSRSLSMQSLLALTQHGVGTFCGTVSTSTEEILWSEVARQALYRTCKGFLLVLMFFCLQCKFYWLDRTQTRCGFFAQYTYSLSLILHRNIDTQQMSFQNFLALESRKAS